MQILRLDVIKLFGLFNHQIPFHTKERITIIHGPNGVGKTTLLKLLAAVFSRRLDVLQQTDYARIDIRFAKRRKLTITRRVHETDHSRSVLIFSYHDGEERKQHTVDPATDTVQYRRRVPPSMIDDYVESLSRLNHEEWYDASTNEVLTYQGVILRYSQFLPMMGGLRPLPEWLVEIFSSISVYFIQTQRLLAAADPRRASSVERRDSRARMTVEDLSKDMARRVQEVLRSSGSLAASLDRTFPHRLLQGKLPSAATERAIRRRYEEQTAYRQRLMAAGLLQAEETLPLQQDILDQSERKVLWYYLGDIDKKLEVYRELLDRAELFTRIINHNKFLYKTLSLHKDQGFIFTSNNGQDVPLSALSSGEQHELVLAYELLFRAKEKSLILIDEPELSLHVTWQHKFLDDMKRISELANLDFLIATHSPSIVHHRTNLMIQLGEVPA
jgi:predicted ATPase